MFEEEDNFFGFTKEELEQYKNDLIKNGYKAEDGKPLKCRFCDCKELESRNEIVEGGIGTVEFDCFCSKCGKKVGSWSYGCWFD